MLLRAVSDHEPEGAATSQVARAAGLARPTTHRMRMALAREGLAERTALGRWVLGPELYLLGTTATPRYDVTAIDGGVFEGGSIVVAEL